MSLLNQPHSSRHILLPNNLLSSDFCPIDLENWFKMVLFWSPVERAGWATVTVSSLLVAMVNQAAYEPLV